MSKRSPDPRTARELERLAGGAWRVSHEEGLHQVDGPAGAFAVAGHPEAARRVAGAQPVVVVWDDFPEEVRESAGVFYVHGDRLVDFLLSQPPRWHDVQERYEIGDRAAAVRTSGHIWGGLSEEGR